MTVIEEIRGIDVRSPEVRTPEPPDGIRAPAPDRVTRTSVSGSRRESRSPEFEIKYRRLRHRRISQGIRYLDRRLGPDWVHHISLQKLDLADPCKCILGQMPLDVESSTGYASWVKKGDSPNARPDTITDTQAVQCGFQARPGDHRDYTLLTASWRRRIERLQLKRSVIHE